ncbi:sensor histidine kinase [Kitasatospora sp. NPDC048365]|uniref:sensor histidine kinase n=1 Tax=Kitasatospora sp. NPDC048365 TaxID=3364050 RepID=UPI0037199D6F
MTTVTGATTFVPHRPTRALLCCAAALLCALAWAVLMITHPHSVPAPYYDGAIVAVFLCFSLAGAFVLVNRAARGLGWALLVTGLALQVSYLAGLAAELGGASGAAGDLVVLTGLIGSTCYAAMMLLFPLWLPDGRLPRGPAGRALVALYAAWGVVIGFVNTAMPPDWYGIDNPLHHGVWASVYRGYADVFGPAGDPVTLGRNIFTAMVAFGLLIAAVRWYRSPGPHRRLVELVAPYLLWMALVIVPYYTGFDPDWAVYAITLVAPTAWLIGLATAFRRDRSLSLDRATRRRLSLCVFLTVLFLLALGLAYAVHQLVPTEHRTAVARWWVLVGAVAFGALLRPLFEAVSRAVDRYYYGERAHPYQVARGLAERLSRTVDPARTPPLLCETAVHSLGLPAAAVRVTGGAGERELAALGTLGPGVERFPMHYEGAEIGALLVAPRTGQPSLDRQDRDVLCLLADQSAPALASLRLTEDLQASRKRLVLAREEERRRLRHDLHDGLGPALSGLRLRLDAAGAGEGRGSPAGIALAAASDGIGQLIVELRRITDGLAPAALDGEGLTGALRRLADSLAGRNLAVALDLRPDPLPPLPAAVEVAVYRISGEALNNVVRHSGASSVRLELRVGEDEVTVEARDNGGGFPHHVDGVGVGLRSMAERAEELGGHFTAANDAQGARVRAVLPRTGPAEQPG